MSNPVTVQKVLQAELNANSGGIDLVFENMPYTPKAKTPWQQVNFLYAEAENPTMGEGFTRDPGIMQITLMWPLHAGSGAAMARASDLKTLFRRGRSFQDGTVRVLIHKNPWHIVAPKQESWFAVAVSVPFIADDPST